MNGLDLVYDEFKSDIERTEHLLNLIKAFKEFGASTPPTQESQDENWSSAINLHDLSRLRRTDLPILSGSLQLYLAGRFEYCIRLIVETLADELSAKVKTYEDLPDVIRKELKQRILDIAQDPKRNGVEESQSDILLAKLVKNFSTESGGFEIDSSLLSRTESNMKGRVLAELLKRVGIIDYWKEVGKQHSVKLALETSLDGEATNEAQTRLNSIMDERNQIAHPTGGTNFPDPDQVLKTAEFLKTLASTTVDLAKVYLATYKPTAK